MEKGLHTFEAASMGNLMPANAEEAKALIMSLTRFGDDEIQEFCNIVKRSTSSHPSLPPSLAPSGPRSRWRALPLSRLELPPLPRSPGLRAAWQLSDCRGCLSHSAGIRRTSVGEGCSLPALTTWGARTVTNVTRLNT